MAITVTDVNFKEVVLDANQPVLIDFWAPWCGPCRMIAPIIDELAEAYSGKAIIAKCDVDTSSEVPLKYGIRNIPTLLFFQKGEMIDKIVGSATKSAIAAKLDTLIK